MRIGNVSRTIDTKFPGAEVEKYSCIIYKGEKIKGTTNRGEDHTESLPLSFYSYFF